MHRLQICLILMVLFFGCHSGRDTEGEASRISDEISSRYIPDKREAIYNISFRAKNRMLFVNGETTAPEARNALMASLKIPGYTLVDSVRILPDISTGPKNWGLITISVCDMHTTPRSAAEVCSQALMGTPVKLLKKTDDWYLVQTPDHYIGWLEQSAVVPTDSSGLAGWNKEKRVIYLPLTGNGFNPESGDAVTDLVAGCILRAGPSTAKGMITFMPDGRSLLIPSRDVQDFDQWKNQPNPSPDQVERCAKSLTGRPYVWGGTSAKGLDCSGFTKTVYFLNGIILARDASLQFLHGGFCDPKEGYEKLKKGDLVFFGRKASGDKPARATHVGIYLGEGDYINSSVFVRTDSFNPAKRNYSKRRSEAWLGGRTILGFEGEKGIVRVREHPWYN